MKSQSYLICNSAGQFVHPGTRLRNLLSRIDHIWGVLQGTFASGKIQRARRKRIRGHGWSCSHSGGHAEASFKGWAYPSVTRAGAAANLLWLAAGVWDAKTFHIMDVTNTISLMMYHRDVQWSTVKDVSCLEFSMLLHYQMNHGK